MTLRPFKIENQILSRERIPPIIEVVKFYFITFPTVLLILPFKIGNQITGVLRPEKVLFTSILVSILKVQTLIKLSYLSNYVTIFAQPLSASMPLCFDTNLQLSA